VQERLRKGDTRIVANDLSFIHSVQLAQRVGLQARYESERAHGVGWEVRKTTVGQSPKLVDPFRVITLPVDSYSYKPRAVRRKSARVGGDSHTPGRLELRTQGERPGKKDPHAGESRCTSMQIAITCAAVGMYYKRLMNISLL
jgi:hypothetical protein